MFSAYSVYCVCYACHYKALFLLLRHDQCLLGPYYVLTQLRKVEVIIISILQIGDGGSERLPNWSSHSQQEVELGGDPSSPDPKAHDFPPCLPGRGLKPRGWGFHSECG